MATQDQQQQQIALNQLMELVQAPDFPGKLVPEHVTQFRSRLERFSETEINAVTERIQEEIEKKRSSNKTLLVSKLEDVAALTKMELVLAEHKVPSHMINLLLTLLVNKSSNFGTPIFDGKMEEFINDSVENAVLNIVLEKAASERTKGDKSGKGKELKELFEKKIRDTETLTHLIHIIDNVDLNNDATMKCVFVVNLVAEAMKREETMRKSESITMKDMINNYLLSKLQMRLAEYNYPNDTLEGIIINRLGQSNNIKRQFRILDHIIETTLSGDLNIELGSKTEKLEWLQLINSLEINVALEQYEEKLAQDNFPTLDDEIKEEIRRVLAADNIADQTIAAISFARRLDNPDESLHDPAKLVEIAAETQYLTSMIFKIKGFQIKEVYEFVELIGELDAKKDDYRRVVEYFKYELPHIDKGVMKEEDSDIKKAALAARYLSARLMSKFDIDPSYLKLSTDYIGLDLTKMPPDMTVDEDELNQRISHFHEIRKRLGFFNSAERAFNAINQVADFIDKERLTLDKPGVHRILDQINDAELGLAVADYVRVGTITKGSDDGDAFNVKYVEAKVKAVFKEESIRAIESDAVKKNIIPESVLAKAEEEGTFEETLLDIKNYGTYLMTRRLDRPEYPRHTQRAVNLILALLQDAIGWRHFENTQIRAKQEVVPLIDEYHRFLGKLLDALDDDKNAEHEEVIGKLRDDDYFAVNDNKDSIEAGKKSAPQVKAEFMTLMNDERFQNYVSQAMGYAETSTHKDWIIYKSALETIKSDLNSHIGKTVTVIEGVVQQLSGDSKNADRFRPFIETLQGKYLDSFKRMQYQLDQNKKPATILKIEYDRLANSEKFKVYLKHCFELIKH